jgi:hypothetical protein
MIINEATFNMFFKGDVVKVANDMLKTNGMQGTVVNTTGCGITVKFEGLPELTYSSKNLQLVERTTFDYFKNEIVKENSNMVVKGNYMVAVVNFVQGLNTTKNYTFALFDDDIFVGDTVLVDTSNGYGVAKIVELLPKKDCEEYGRYSLPTKEVICRIDFSAFNERKEKRAKAAQLKKEMDVKVKSLQEIAVFELLAEKSPELKEMLETYKSLID